MSSKIVFDNNILGLMKSFDKITHAKLKDCIVEDNKIIFVVNEGEIRKSIGNKAENVKKLAEIFRKKIKIIEYSNEMLKLIRNFIYPLKIDNIHEEGGIVVLESTDTRTRGLLIGRAAQNLRRLENYIRRYFEVKEIKVV